MLDLLESVDEIPAIVYAPLLFVSIVNILLMLYTSPG